MLTANVIGGSTRNKTLQDTQPAPNLLSIRRRPPNIVSQPGKSARRFYFLAKGGGVNPRSAPLASEAHGSG